MIVVKAFLYFTKSSSIKLRTKIYSINNSPLSSAWIEQSFSKAQVGGSNPSVGVNASRLIGNKNEYRDSRLSKNENFKKFYPYTISS